MFFFVRQFEIGLQIVNSRNEETNSIRDLVARGSSYNCTMLRPRQNRAGIICHEAAKPTQKVLRVQFKVSICTDSAVM